MTRIFLSHSSQNNPRAFALAQWLRENGWQDVFLDRIPRQGIAAGEDWKARIHEAMDSSVAGIFLISRGWKDSTWCQAELTLAYSLNKLIFGVLVDDLPRDEIPELLKSNWQLVDLQGGRDHDLHDVTFGDGTTAQATLSRSGLANLKEGLHRARIAPEHFTWPPEDEPDRPPWRGLSPMEPEDAGIFFGREAQTGRALDAIRALRDSNPPRLLAIVGASGAGKSSFLRAGLIPRLRRDDRNYLTLPPIRPEGGALDAFAKSLTETAKQKSPRALSDIRRIVHAAAEGAPEALSQFLTELAQAHRLPAFDDQPPPIPTIILPVDQGEELFQSSGRAQGGPFLSLLSHLLHQDSPRFLALITIRSDSYEALQNAPQLSGMNHSTLSLPAIAKGEYSRIIMGPIDKLQSAGRKLEFDPAITNTLLAEFDKGLGSDALPMLAFTLDRLYRDYHGAREITLDDYKTMGGIAGSIDAAVRNALTEAAKKTPLPEGDKELNILLRRTMIPWFAGIDPETGTARRNVSARDQLPLETLPLVDALIDQRLLTRDGNQIEPAHEALLREWRALGTWLVEDREKLTTLEALRRAAADWQGKGRQKNYLDHRAERLDEAERLADRPDLWRRLGAIDHDYLKVCRTAANRELFWRKARPAGFAVVVGLGVIMTGHQAWNATKSKNDAIALLALSKAENDPTSALKLVITSWQNAPLRTFPNPQVTIKTVILAADGFISRRGWIAHDAEIKSLAVSSSGALLATGDINGVIQVWDVESGELIVRKDPISGSSIELVKFFDDSTLLVGRSDGSTQLWSFQVSEPIQIHKTNPPDPPTSFGFLSDKNEVFVGYKSGSIRIFDKSSGAIKFEGLNFHETSIQTMVPLSTTHLFTVGGSEYDIARFWKITRNSKGGIAIESTMDEFSGDGGWGTNNTSKASGVFAYESVDEWGDSRESVRLSLRKINDIGYDYLVTYNAFFDQLSSIEFSVDGRYVAALDYSGLLRMFDVETGREVGNGLRAPGLRQFALLPEGAGIVGVIGNGDIWTWESPTAPPLIEGVLVDSPSVQRYFQAGAEAIFVPASDQSGRNWAKDLPSSNVLQIACRMLPTFGGKLDTSADGVAAEIGIEDLTLPEDCDTYDPPLPPEFRQ